MKINSLQIKAFRGIKQLKIAFSHRTTVFVGINGVGKTAILDCLAILLSHLTNRMTDTNERPYKKSDIYNGASDTHNKITVSINGDDASWATRTNQNGKQILSVLEQREQVDSIIEKVYSNLSENPNSAIPLVVYYPVNRAVFDVDISLNITEKPDFHQLTALEQAFSRTNTDFQSFFEWFRNREDIENEHIRNETGYHRDRQLEAVRQAIQSLMPGYTDLRVRRLPLRMTLSKQHFSPKQELIINQLSDGEKCLLALTGDLVRRLAIANPALLNPLEGEAIVLIDEIDLHLHPQWQHAVIPMLEKTFPHCQFIVSTHSPQVISEVQRQNCVYFLRTTKDGGIVAERVKNAYGKDSNFILEVFMDTDERPENIKMDIETLSDFIDAGKLNEAKMLLQQLRNKIGDDEPTLVGAEVLIRRKEIIKR
jgi:predicted ATP-binding protein involved in virulence